MSDFLVSVSGGLFGIAGAGVAAVWAGSFLYRPKASFSGDHTDSITVLIPAHNEEKDLPATVASIQAAALRGGVRARIVVGADSCADRTAAVAKGLGAQVQVLNAQSKWKTISALAQKLELNGWVALVDAGAIWPPSLLVDLLPSFADRSLLGVAPAYFPQRASRLERLLWNAEARWKSLENRAGGPVSVHGATVFFRARVLHAGLAFLKDFPIESWLNDDIALPISARILFPQARLMYWRPPETERRVSDAGLREMERQLGRRRRMAVGNLQWMILLWPIALRRAPAVALVAVRRIARMFWAYWIFLSVYGLCSLLLPARPAALALAFSLVTIGGALSWAIGKRGIVEAGIASLEMPFMFPTAAWSRGHRWS